MTTLDTIRTTPEQYLTAADQEFAAGNHDNGSELLYQSVVCALSQLAADYGRPGKTHSELKEFAGWLDEKYAGNGRYARKFRVAESFHNNAKYRFYHPDDIDIIKPAVWDFVDILSSYRQQTVDAD